MCELCGLVVGELRYLVTFPDLTRKWYCDDCMLPVVQAFMTRRTYPREVKKYTLTPDGDWQEQDRYDFGT